MLYIILMCISHFMFYANNLLLDVCFIFILDYRNYIRQQIQVIFLSSKWVIKQRGQLAISATHLAQKLLMNVQCSGGLRSFAKKMRALKMRSAVAGHQKWTTTD